MANNIRVELKPGAVTKLLKSPEIRADLERRAGNIARAAGPGMSFDSSVGRNRARATVWTDSLEAIRAEASDRDLTRAIDAGRQ